MDTILTIEVGVGSEARCPVSRLLVDNLTQFEQLLVASDIIEPMHNQQVIACTLCSPECPVTQRSLWQLLQLVVEIFCHKINYALIASSHIVLLKNLQRHHTRPPVGSIVTLHTVDVRTVGVGTEVATLFLRVEDSLHPLQRLCLQGIVAHNICHWKSTINPVWTTLPGITLATEPGVVVTTYQLIEFVEVTCHSVQHNTHLLVEPALRLDVTNRELCIRSLHQWSAVKYRLWTSRGRLLCRGCKCANHSNSQN